MNGARLSGPSIDAASGDNAARCCRTTQRGRNGGSQHERPFTRASCNGLNCPVAGIGGVGD